MQISGVLFIFGLLSYHKIEFQQISHRNFRNAFTEKKICLRVLRFLAIVGFSFPSRKAAHAANDCSHSCWLYDTLCFHFPIFASGLALIIYRPSGWLRPQAEIRSAQPATRQTRIISVLRVSTSKHSYNPVNLPGHDFRPFIPCIFDVSSTTCVVDETLTKGQNSQPLQGFHIGLECVMFLGSTHRCDENYNGCLKETCAVRCSGLSQAAAYVHCNSAPQPSRIFQCLR